MKEVDRHVASLLKPYVGKTDYYIRNSEHFIETVKDIKVDIM